LDIAISASIYGYYRLLSGSGLDYCEVLLGFEHRFGSHTGENPSKTVIQLLADHGITHRVLSVTTDNATNNNTLMVNVQEAIQSQS
jgi:hypothetical protein